MGMQQGSTPINKVMYGSVEITRIYSGSSVVYDSAPPDTEVPKTLVLVWSGEPEDYVEVSTDG